MIATYPLIYKRFAVPSRRATPAPALTALERLALPDLEDLIHLGLTLLIARGLATASDVALLGELGAA